MFPRELGAVIILYNKVLSIPFLDGIISGSKNGSALSKRLEVVLKFDKKEKA